MIKCELLNVDNDSSNAKIELDINDTNNLTLELGYMISIIVNTAIMSMDSDSLITLDFNDFVPKVLACSLGIASVELAKRLEINHHDLVKDTMTHYKEFSKMIFKD